mgnify:CR=1 FL=1
MIRGDLLESDCNILIHQANCFHTMGAGIALALRKRWPKVFEADKKSKKGDEGKLGTFTVANVADSKWVVNLYAQHRYGRDRRYTNYDALSDGLKAISLRLNERNSSLKVGMPKMGCYNAGGSWTIVKAIIEDAFPHRTVYVYYL